MKSLNTYINEGLADWSDDKLDKKISKQTTKSAIKQEIIDWIENNTYGRIYKNKLKFDFDTSPITVDYDGDIELKSKADSLTNGIFQWGYVGGGFNCNDTRITSLEGAPKKVKWFSCSHTDIESLEGCPGNALHFECINCPKLKSLDGCPQQAEDFNCKRCYNITSLKGCPKELLGGFNCSYTGIKNLKGGPIKSKDYDCSNCENLVSLEGGPKQVEYNFYCYDCPKLKSLEGGPEIIIYPEGNSRYDCSETGIKNLKGAPKKVQSFICNSCDNLISLEGCPSSDYLINAQYCPNLKSLKHIPLDAKCNLMINSTPIEDVGDLYNSKIKFIYFSQNCPAKDELRRYLKINV